MKINEICLVVFDLETTNPPENYQKHEIIEIAGVEVMAGDVNIGKSFHSLVKPPCEIQPHNFRVSGISNEMVKNAPTINEVMPKFLGFIEDAPLVAHNVAFDAKVFNENLIALGYDELPNIFICTMKLSKKIYTEEKNHGLNEVMERLGIKAPTKERHRALGDVKATARVFCKFLDILKQHYIVTIEDVNRLCNTDVEIKDFQQLELF